MKLSAVTLKRLFPLLLLLLIVGCESQSSPDVKRARLVNNENIQLNEKLNKQDEEIKKLTASLDKCRQQSKETAEFLMELPSEITKQNSKLLTENDKLKAQLAELKTP